MITMELNIIKLPSFSTFSPLRSLALPLELHGQNLDELLLLAFRDLSDVPAAEGLDDELRVVSLSENDRSLRA